MRIMDIENDENYDKAVENYIQENEDVLKETYGSRYKEEGRIEFWYMSQEDKLNFLY